MKPILCLLALCFVMCTSKKQPEPIDTTRIPWPDTLPVYDHIVIVVEENHGYDSIVGNINAPYINDVLIKEGAASFNWMFGNQHPSQPNYYWLFSGSNQGIMNDGPVPDTCKASNLGYQLIQNKYTFKGYSDGLDSIGGTRGTNFAPRHVPWPRFTNVPNGKTYATSSNLRLIDFPQSPNYDSLPTIAFIIPDVTHDMHNDDVEDGDNWLRANIDAYYQWAKNHNSLLIITWDECLPQSPMGLTTPSNIPYRAQGPNDRGPQNRIATIFAGAHIVPGGYDEYHPAKGVKGITHVNILRTIESMYTLPKSGKQQQNALDFGIPDDFIITDVFSKVKR